MSMQEDFKDRLRQIGLAHGKKAATEKLLRDQVGHQETMEKIKTWARKADEEMGQNRQVLKLDANLPIKQYLEALRDEMFPEQRLEKWGPWRGEMAYAFVYGFSERKVIDRPAGSMPRGVGRGLGLGTIYDPITEVSHIESGRNILGTMIDGPAATVGVYRLWQKKSSWVQFPNLFGPAPAWQEADLIKRIDGINSTTGIEQFTQTLTNFYAGLKTGQGK